MLQQEAMHSLETFKVITFSHPTPDSLTKHLVRGVLSLNMDSIAIMLHPAQVQKSNITCVEY